MNAESINRMLRAQPFLPFRIHLSNGMTYEIRHPDLAIPGRSTLFIGLLSSGSVAPFADDFATVSYLHINNVETIRAAAPQAGGNGVG